MDIQEIFLECLFCCEWFLRNGAKLKFFHLWVIENRILSQIKYIYYLILKKCVFYEKSHFIFESDKYFFWKCVDFFFFNFYNVPVNKTIDLTESEETDMLTCFSISASQDDTVSVMPYFYFISVHNISHKYSHSWPLHICVLFCV